MRKSALVIVLALLAATLLPGCAPEPVVLYTDLGKSEVEQLIAPFLETSGVKVQIVTFGSSESLMRALGVNGDNRGRRDGPTPTPNPTPADVVLIRDMMLTDQLAEAGVLVNYAPPGAAGLPYGANGGGFWYGFGGTGWVLMWNTELAARNPDSYTDLADNAYPLRSVAVPSPEQFYFYPLAAYCILGADYTMGIFQTLMLNEARFVPSAKDAANGVANGKYHIAVTTYALAKELKDGGAPVDFVFADQGQSEMGAYVAFYSAGLAKGGRNLKGAKLLDDWLLSPEAEALSVKIGLSDVTMRDVGSGAPVVKPLVVSPGEILRKSEEASNAFGRMAGAIGN